MSASGSMTVLGSSLLGGSPGPSGGASTAQPLSIVSTEPASSSTVDISPSVLTIRFSEPLDAFSIGSTDFSLVHVEGDGTTQPLGAGEASFIEALDPSDPTGSQIELTLSRPLADGHYRLIALGSGRLQGADGSSLSTPGTDTIVSDFTVGGGVAGLSSAVDLGIPNSTPIVHPDVLPLASNPGAVDYYKVTLAPGHKWRLGLDVQSSDGPGKVDTTLSLLDSGGKLIATESLGPANAPGDPYLFAGVGPGVYYVSVSARGIVPVTSGGHGQGPEAGASSASAPSDGLFQLSVVADPADHPTSVLGLRVDHADPLSMAPTGLTLQFDASIQLTALKSATQPAVSLVDQNGVSWALTPSGYNATLGQLSFVLDQALPAGQYSLVLTGNGGLVDLAGQAPVAPGLPAGVLGCFTVSPTSPASGDLGTILRDVAESGLVANLPVAARSSISERFTIVLPGNYTLSGPGAISGVSFSLADSSSDVLASNSTATPQGTANVFLPVGTYSLTLTNAGASSALVPITILERGIEFSQLIDGGVGQGPAFSLRLVTPEAGFGGSNDASSASSAVAPPAPSPTVSASADGPSATPAGPVPVDPAMSGPVSTPAPNPAIGSQTPTGTPASTTALFGSARDDSSSMSPSIGWATPVGPSSAFSSFSTVPVGHPSAQSNQISAVGPAGASGSVALASNSAALPPGLSVVPMAISPAGDAEPQANPMDPEIRIEGVAPLQRGSTLETGLLSRPPAGRKEDEVWLNGADWFGRVVSAAVGWLAEGEPVSIDSDPRISKVDTSPKPDAPAEMTVEYNIERASLVSPIGVGILTMLALRYVGRRIGRVGKVESRIEDREIRSILTGPHRRIGRPIRR